MRRVRNERQWSLAAAEGANPSAKSVAGLAARKNEPAPGWIASGSGIAFQKSPNHRLLGPLRRNLLALFGRPPRCLATATNSAEVARKLLAGTEAPI